MRRIEKKYSKNSDLPIVLIGHSKSFIRHNEKSFDSLLKFVSNNKLKYHFSLFNELDLESFE